MRRLDVRVYAKQEVPATPSAIGEPLLAWRTLLDMQRTPQEVVHLAASNCKNTLREWKKLLVFPGPLGALS